MNPENLPSHELFENTDTPLVDIPQGGFTEDWVLATYTARKSALENFKSIISLKTYYALVEKLDREKTECMELLNKNEKETTELAKYTFLLDPGYFEQLFFNSDKWLITSTKSNTILRLHTDELRITHY